MDAARPEPRRTRTTSAGTAALTSPQIEVIAAPSARTPRSFCAPRRSARRTYVRLSEIEHEAFHARIWGGLHFRQAMMDTYEMGHRTAVRVMEALD